VTADLVDLRSDTVTRPTQAMRQAMAVAVVGDDGYGEDPTVNELEHAYARRVGKAAALFVPSGTMANQVALRVLARPGSAVIVGRRQHVIAYELGAGPMNAGVQFVALADDTGLLDPSEVAFARAAAAHHQPVPSLVCIENTHMASGGVAWTEADLATLHEVTGDLPVHMDGARLFNAEVATGVPADRIAAGVTTVMTCLSKGLCAPVGSLLAGPAPVIEAARLERKRLGGAMRQAGVLAAAGLVALETMVDRLADDHRRARRLAEAVAERWPACGLVPEDVRTNVVAFEHPSPPALIESLREDGILAGTIAPGIVRLMTHRDVDDEGVERAAAVLAKAPR
jgi:threonine aldolase